MGEVEIPSSSSDPYSDLFDLIRSSCSGSIFDRPSFIYLQASFCQRLLEFGKLDVFMLGNWFVDFTDKFVIITNRFECIDFALLGSNGCPDFSR